MIVPVIHKTQKWYDYIERQLVKIGNQFYVMQNGLYDIRITQYDAGTHCVLIDRNTSYPHNIIEFDNSEFDLFLRHLSNSKLSV